MGRSRRRSRDMQGPGGHRSGECHRPRAWPHLNPRVTVRKLGSTPRRTWCATSGRGPAVRVSLRFNAVLGLGVRPGNSSAGAPALRLPLSGHRQLHRRARRPATRCFSTRSPPSSCPTSISPSRSSSVLGRRSTSGSADTSPCGRLLGSLLVFAVDALAFWYVSLQLSRVGGCCPSSTSGSACSASSRPRRSGRSPITC